MLGRAMASITKAEAAYEQKIEDASNIVDVEGEEDRTETEEASEEAALDTFTDKVEEVRALADEMITLILCFTRSHQRRIPRCPQADKQLYGRI